MASATLTFTLGMSQSGVPQTVTLTGTRAAHSKTFAPVLDAAFSLPGDQYTAFRAAVASWMIATGEYTNTEANDLFYDAQVRGRSSRAPCFAWIRNTHPLPDNRVPFVRNPQSGDATSWGFE